MLFRIVLACALAAAACAPGRAELPSVAVTKIFEDSAGGSFTVASQVQIDGKRVFLKSSRGSMRGTRYANFEADILARRIFERVGIRCPAARMVRIGSAPSTSYGRPLERQLGTAVLAMEFVDTRFASGRVGHGLWPDEGADVDRFIDLFLVDVVIGNADRRGANLFVAERYDAGDAPGRVRPIPIDNNAGFGTMVVWNMPTSQLNFVETYAGIGKQDVMRDLGTIRNIVLDSDVHHQLIAQKKLRPRIRARAKELVARLDDAFIDAIVAELPREIIPRGVVFDPTDGKWRASFSKAELALLDGPATGKLSGAELFQYRVAEIARRLRWRRDHLVPALTAYLDEEADAPPPTQGW